MIKQICQIFVQAITMRHVMSGFHFVLADFSDLNTVVQHTLNNPVHARFIRFNPVTFAYFPCMRVTCLRSEYRIISSDFFFLEKITVSRSYEIHFFFTFLGSLARS